ncbi:Aste57867_24771 [Aphanomyces stellatus]|uniref:Aste57867_24771 protein n=1 Tax=Aphanomyces stellatus TaxID=120398 RepID=A0A485LTE5_9STRA|nr:hypothetical protein As57867_024693 [Aphanomyces stellatus]VFU01407.1 Aste57867_24771 [Aphanomyces stellatus]
MCETPVTARPFFIDLFNATIQSNGSVDLLAPTAVYSIIDKVAITASYPTYARRLDLTQLTSVEYAVTDLRTLSGYRSVWVSTQYCWVDMNRTFEVAHTAARQRCSDRYYSTNGAVYIETILRCQEWDNFIQNYEPVVVHLQWHNRIQIGIADSIVVESAIQLAQPVGLKNVPRTIENPTSPNMSTTWYCKVQIEASSDRLPPVNFKAQLGLHDSNGNNANQRGALHHTIGPFNSVNTFYVVVAPALLASQPNARLVLGALAVMALRPPVPPPWVASGTMDPLMYSGGNRICLYGGPLPYVQDSFGFIVACVDQPPVTVSLTQNIPFSLLPWPTCLQQKEDYAVSLCNSVDSPLCATN